METTVTELTAQLTDSKEKVSQLDAQVAHVFTQYRYFPLLPKILICDTMQHLQDLRLSCCALTVFLLLYFQLKAKTEMLLSAEAAKAAQKANMENSLETAQHALQDKQQVTAVFVIFFYFFLLSSSPIDSPVAGVK